MSQNNWGIDVSNIKISKKPALQDFGDDIVRGNPSNGLVQVGLNPIRLPQPMQTEQSLENIPFIDKIKLGIDAVQKGSVPDLTIMSEEGKKAVRPIVKAVARVAPQIADGVLQPESQDLYQGYVLKYGKQLMDLFAGVQEQKVSLSNFYSKFLEYQKLLLDKHKKGYTPQIYGKISPYYSKLGWGLLFDKSPQLARDAWRRHAEANNIEWLKWLTKDKTNFYGAPIGIAALVGVPLIWGLTSLLTGGNKEKKKKRRRRPGYYGAEPEGYKQNGYYDIA